MSENNVPANWYVYDSYLRDNPNAPVPSHANYKAKNLSGLMDSLGAIIGQSGSNVQFIFYNNTPNSPANYIKVSHPGGQTTVKAKSKSPELERYEEFAKNSAILKLFQDNSPAEIEYFKPLS
jgi:hypothetical protein